MTTPITKERLIKIQQWREIYGADSNVVLPAEEAEELARIALAAMDVEPIVYMNRFTGRAFELEEQPGVDKDPAVYMPLYAAPPAPVCSRPVHPAISSEELDDETLDELIEFRRSTLEYHSQQGNKVQTIIHGVTLTALFELRERRAAMLQDSTLINNVTINNSHTR